jgi:hypothetical protein
MKFAVAIAFALVLICVSAAPKLGFEDDSGECTIKKLGARLDVISGCDFSVNNRNVLDEIDAIKTDVSGLKTAVKALQGHQALATEAPTEAPTLAPTKSGPTYEYLGEGQCRGDSGSSPPHYWGTRGTEDLCREQANAIDAQGYECNGGRPNQCACQLFFKNDGNGRGIGSENLRRYWDKPWFPITQLLRDGSSFGCWRRK